MDTDGVYLCNYEPRGDPNCSHQKRSIREDCILIDSNAYAVNCVTVSTRYQNGWTGLIAPIDCFHVILVSEVNTLRVQITLGSIVDCHMSKRENAKIANGLR